MLKKFLNSLFLSHFTALDYPVAAIFYIFIFGSLIQMLTGFLVGLL